LYLVSIVDILVVLPARERLYCLRLEMEMKSFSFCLLLFDVCVDDAYRKRIFKQIVENWVVGTMVYYKMDSVSRFLDDHDETWGSVTADGLLNSWLRTECSRNALYHVVSHWIYQSVGMSSDHSVIQPVSLTGNANKPAGKFNHISELANKSVNQPLNNSTVEADIHPGTPPVTSQSTS
jgi:hypothetical protein